MRVAALALLWIAGGCQDEYERAKREADAVVVDLPRAVAEGLDAPRPRTRVVVRPGRIDVDQAELVASWDPDHRDSLIDATPGRSLHLAWPRVIRLAGLGLRTADRPDRGGYLLAALHRVLMRAAQVEKKFADFDSEAPFDGHLQVLAARATPFDLLSRVLYTAGQAEYGGWEFALSTGDQAAILLVEAPRIGDRDREGCLTPELIVRPNGIQVRAAPAGVRLQRTSGELASVLGGGGGGSSEDAGARPPEPPTPATEPSWLDAVVLGPRRACPSVPKRGGHQDVRALVALLHEMERLAPRCRTARVSARPDTTWDELAAVLQAVRQAGYENPQIAASTMPDEPTSCEGGIRP